METTLAAGEVKARFRATLPLEAAVPDDRARESGPNCAKEARADNREAIAKINALWLRVEEVFIGSHVGSISIAVEIRFYSYRSKLEDYETYSPRRPSPLKKARVFDCYWVATARV